MRLLIGLLAFMNVLALIAALLFLRMVRRETRRVAEMSEATRRLVEHIEGQTEEGEAALKAPETSDPPVASDDTV